MPKLRESFSATSPICIAENNGNEKLLDFNSKQLVAECDDQN